VLTDIVVKVKESGLGPPAIIVVGDVVRLRQKLNWYEPQPLFGKRVMVTSSRDQAGVFTEKLMAQGATVIVFPTIDVIRPADWTGLDKSLDALETYDWIIFRSVNAVKFFMLRLRELGKDVRLLKGVNICASGPKIAGALEQSGLRPDLMPAEFTDKGVLDALSAEKIDGQRYFLPLEKAAHEIIPERLRELGADVTVATAYENVRPAADVTRVKKLLHDKKVAAITFTSAAAVRTFIEMLGESDYKQLTEDVAIACIGPQTARTVEEYGMRTDILPAEHTIPALIDSMAEYFSKH
jgi:uroporphyrinogen III methyltransferase/synthase